MRRLLLAIALTACTTAEPEPQAAAALPSATTDSADVLAPPRRPRLHPTCGDPVCRGYQGPFAGVPSCRSYVQGDRCPPRAIGLTCDPVNACNALLECRRNPNPGPCPISLARYKREVHHLDPAQVQALHDAVLAIPLSTWNYHWDGAETPARLGFIIDELGASPAVTEDGGHVDLYGYTSLAVAGLQAQARRIDTLEARLAALEDKLAER